MDINDLHPPNDYSHRFFIWHEWIQVHGPLTTENVFDYFATSMFYDKQSNNQVLRMQTMHTGMPIVNESEELKRFTGVEFAVVQAMPPSLFVIQKRERLSPDEVRPLAAYFIVNNRIYQSPDVYTVLSNRLLTSLYSLQSSLDILRAHRPDFTSRTGFVWPIVDTSSGTSEEAIKRRGVSEDPTHLADGTSSTTQQSSLSGSSGKRKVADGGTGVSVSLSTAAAAAAGSPRRQQNSTLLLNAMWTTGVHSNTMFALGMLGQSEPLSEAPEAVGGLGQAARSSATPAPSTAEPAAVTSKAQQGVVKKRRKRTLLAPPVSAAAETPAPHAPSA